MNLLSLIFHFEGKEYLSMAKEIKKLICKCSINEFFDKKYLVLRM